MSAPAIQVNGLGKRYQIGLRAATYRTLRESLTAAATEPFRGLRRSMARLSGNGRTADDAPDHIWALRDVSFEVHVAEVVGVIGRNGAGKSTLLKILSRITRPTTGWAKIKGRVGSLLEVGTGFHPELTGRENIFLNGAILGMKKVEIDRKFDEIVAFSEIEKFIDTPVKHYSSGMYVRLAFAVAAHLEPEILLVDEVLAVGDSAFQKKCLGKIGDVVQEGRTVLFVSHNMAAVQALCTSCMLLEQGAVQQVGDTQDVIDAYLASIAEKRSLDLAGRTDRRGDGTLRLTGIEFWNSGGQPIIVAQSGQDIQVVLRYRSHRTALNNVGLKIYFNDARGQLLFYCNSELTGELFQSLASEGRLVCSLPRLPLLPGVYTLSLRCRVNGVVADDIREAWHITVESGDFFGSGRMPPMRRGGVLVPNSWRALDSTVEGR